jgi:membrane dipeptidase
MSEIERRRLVAEDSLWTRALDLHYDAVVLDGHMDTPTLTIDEGYDATERHTPLRGKRHVDFPRMREGGLDGGFFSIYVSSRYGEGEAATERARQMLRTFKEQVDRTDRAEVALTADDVLRLARKGTAAVLFGLEGGHALQADVEVLRELHGLGIRYVTLTHVNTNLFADASQSRPRWDGLNDKGRLLVEEMNRLGVLVDVSHTSDSTFFDAIAASRAPVIASHSSARAIVDNVRNLSDEQLRVLGASGGVAMINFFDPTVNRHFDDEVMEATYRRVERDYGGNLRMIWNAAMQERYARGFGRGTADDVVAHIHHAAQVAGVEHVGLGSDFDGAFSFPIGLEDVTDLPKITYGLLKLGYTDAEIRGVLGGNVLRVMREAERVSRDMQSAGAGS